jgi:hypothetical protein
MLTRIKKQYIKGGENVSCGTNEAELIDDICQRNTLTELAEQYISFCLSTDENAGSKQGNRVRLPNICGFFRWLRLGASALDRLKRDHSEEYRTLQMIFEDEALNSPLPPSIISTYMKQSFSSRLDDSSVSESTCGPITLVFEHDIDNDGR